MNQTVITTEHNTFCKYDCFSSHVKWKKQQLFQFIELVHDDYAEKRNINTSIGNNFLCLFIFWFVFNFGVITPVTIIRPKKDDQHLLLQFNGLSFLMKWKRNINLISPILLMKYKLIENRWNAWITKQVWIDIDIESCKVKQFICHTSTSLAEYWFYALKYGAIITRSNLIVCSEKILAHQLHS